jgi:hypothetical protein
VCSIFKTVELSALKKTTDPTWDGVDLTIWSGTELSVGILVSSLPPLRKQFDRLFHIIFPSTITSRNKSKRASIPLYNISKKTAGRSERRTEADDGDSERHILPDDVPADGKIMKTVVHEFYNSERTGSISRMPSSEKAHNAYDQTA